MIKIPRFNRPTVDKIKNEFKNKSIGKDVIIWMLVIVILVLLTIIVF